MMKQNNVMLFGALIDITGNKSFVVNDVDTTDALIELLETKYPALKSMKYSVAVDKKIVTGNTIIPANALVAVLPPFSGG